MKDGKIDWQMVDQQVSALVSNAVESVTGALRQRYYHEDGALGDSVKKGYFFEVPVALNLGYGCIW